MICLCFFHFVKKCGLTSLKEGSMLPSRFWPLAQRHRCRHREVALCGNYFLPGCCLFALCPLPSPHHPPQPSCLTHLCMLCVDRGTCGFSEATWERILPQGYKVPFRSIKATLEKYPKPPETYAGSWAPPPSHRRSAEAFEPTPQWPVSTAQPNSRMGPAGNHRNRMALSSFQNKHIKGKGKKKLWAITEQSYIEDSQAEWATEYY